MQKLSKLLFIIFTIYSISCAVYADDNIPAKQDIMIKEDNTPPAAEGPLPADQIPPLLSSKRNNAA